MAVSQISDGGIAALSRKNPTARWIGAGPEACAPSCALRFIHLHEA